MAIQRVDPVRDLVELQNKVNRLFEDTRSRSGSPEGMESTGWRPSMDLFEAEDNYVLRADVPGVAAGGVEIHVENGRLHLRGERKMDATVARDAYLRVERPYGRFAVQVSLPPSVDRQGIRASHRGGVVEVLLPKKKEEAARHVEVSVPSP